MADIRHYLTQTSHDKLKRLVERVGDRLPQHLPPLAGLISAGDPEIVRMGYIYGGSIAAAEYEGGKCKTPRKGEGQLHRIKADASGMEDPDNPGEPEVVYNVSQQILAENTECLFLRDRSINDAANETVLQPGWLAIPLSPSTNLRSGFGIFRVSGTTSPSDTGLLNRTSTAIELVNSSDITPVVVGDVAGAGPAFQALHVTASGNYRFTFDARISFSSPAEPTPPPVRSFQNKIAQVTGTADLETGEVTGTASDLCLHRIYRREQFWLFKNANFGAPTVADGIAVLDPTAIYECSELEAPRQHYSLPIELNANDTLSVWHNASATVNPTLINVSYQVEFSIHYESREVELS